MTYDAPTSDLSLSTGFSSLPPELFDLILDELIELTLITGGKRLTLTRLAQLARVAKSWTAPVSVRLYEHVEIWSTRDAWNVGRSGALKRYARKSLSFKGIEFGWSNVETIVRDSPGVKELHIGSDCRNVPTSLWESTGLKDLEVLSLLGRMAEHQPTISTPRSIHVRKLVTNLSAINGTTLQAIINRKLMDHKCSLAELELREVVDAPAFWALQPLAPSLQSLTISHSSLSESCLTDPTSLIPLLVTFISFATSLSHLTLDLNTYSVRLDLVEITVLILGAVKSPLKSLDIGLSQRLVLRTNLLDLLEDGLATWAGLAKLEILEFSRVYLEDAEMLKRWCDFETVLVRRNMKLVTGTWWEKRL